MHYHKIVGKLMLRLLLLCLCLFASADATAIPPQLGTRKILVVMADFPDVPNTTLTADAVSNVMQSVNAFYLSNSFNQLSITSTVVGPFRMPAASSNYVIDFNVTGLRNDAMAAAVAAGYNASNFDYDIVTFTNINFPFYGWANLGARGLWLQAMPGFPFQEPPVAHELGHNLGLNHAHAWLSPTTIGPGSSSEGGNPFDTMGGGPSHFNSNFKVQLGWIPTNYVHLASSNGTYRIYPEDQCGSLNVSRKYALVVPAAVTTPGDSEDYWVECRHLIDNPTIHNGVLVMWGNTQSTGDCFLLDTTPGSQTGSADLLDTSVTVGRSFTDPNKHITISVVATGGMDADTYFDVQVVFNSGAVPPAIIIQPTNQFVLAGTNTVISTTATSSAGIDYQWLRYGEAIPGATNFSLSFYNVTADQSGDYQVVLSNAMGSVVSSPATLFVSYPAPSTCYPIPSGIVSWWPGDGHPLDWIGTNHATWHSSYAPGMVGQSFLLNGVSDWIEIPNSPAWAFRTNDFTIELWAKFFAVGGDTAFVATDNGGGQLDKWLFWRNDGRLRFYAVNTSGSSDNIGTASFAPVTNQWYHLAVTRTGNFYTFYINGAAVSTNFSIVTIPAPIAPLTLGGNLGGALLSGQLDEVRIYNRCLSGAEILGIYASGSVGSCWPSNPPAYVEFSNATTTVQAGTNNDGVLVRCAGNSNRTISVSCTSSNGTATAGIDYVPVADTLTFNPGELNHTVGISVLNKVPFVGTKQFSLQLSPLSSNVVFGTKDQTVSIIGDGCLAPMAGLIGWWSGNNNPNDQAGTNDAILRNYASYAPGKVGSAFSFNGVDDYVEVPNPAAGSFNTNSPMSICLWVNRTSTNSGMHIFGKRFGCTGSGISYHMGYGPGFGGVFFNTDNGGVYPNRDLPTNTWTHLAVTFDGTKFCFYYNGILAGTGSGALGVPNPSTLRIGKSGDCGNTFGGLIDEFLLFNRALSPDEVQAIYSADSRGMCPRDLILGRLRYDQTNGFAATLNLRIGQPYRVQVNTNLISTNWNTIANLTGSTASAVQFIDPTATNSPRRFYRILEP